MPRGAPKIHTEFLSLKIDPSLIHMIQSLAAREGRSTGQFARILLREALSYRFGGSAETAKRIGLEGETTFARWSEAVKLVKAGKPVPPDFFYSSPDTEGNPEDDSAFVILPKPKRTRKKPDG